METEEKKDETKETKEKEPDKIKEKKPEPLFEILENPARVTRSQLKYITFDVDPRYVPITHQVHQ
jgi:26S proteasome regulatory subunit N2